MSLYPRFMYISYGSTKRYRKVAVNGYRQDISLDGFTNLNMTVPFDLLNKVGYAGYDYVYRIHTEYDLEQHLMSEKRLMERYPEVFSKEITVDSRSIDLYDYYQEIGYDRKKKHFNGLTLRQHILKEVNNLDRTEQTN